MEGGGERWASKNVYGEGVWSANVSNYDAMNVFWGQMKQI